MVVEKRNYPQIPTRVWWGLRSIIKNRPSAKLSDSILATQLSVQPSAAKAYLNQFKIIGILDEEGASTPLASKWRNDSTYEEAKRTILDNSYPSELVEAYPPNEADVQKVSDWFEIGGLGAGTARNKASTYVLIANSKPGDFDSTPAPKERTQPASRSKEGKTTRQSRVKTALKIDSETQTPAFPDLNVNIQIHISADASNEQIETIFASMQKYLRP